MTKPSFSTVLAAGLLVGISGLGCTQYSPSQAPGLSKPKTLMLVVAHPDDESMIGPMLTKLARRGHLVQVVIATDGKYGTRVTDVPEGDELGRLRRIESDCAAAKLGIPRPIYLGIDRLDTRNGVRPYLEGRKVLLAALKQHLAAINPDALLTFGPDGEYGHSEHIVIGAAVTELLLRDGIAEKYPLYYFAWTKEQVSDDDDLGYVDPRYLTSKLNFTDEDERKSFESAECYTTQMTRDEIDELIRRESADKTNTLYFRKFWVGQAEIPGDDFETW